MALAIVCESRLDLSSSRLDRVRGALSLALVAGVTPISQRVASQ